MKRSLLSGLGIAAAVSLALAGCGSGDAGTTEPDDAGGAADPAATEEAAPAEDALGEVTLSMAGWSLASTPEFQTLADGFMAANPSVTVEVKEYDATNYDTQMIADLAAGAAPDIYVQKNNKNFFTYQDGEQLLDVSDVAEGLGDDVSGLSSYEVDGATYAVPYRQDSWYLYYNKDLFDAAGVEHPDGSWTWDDYADAAKELTDGLKAAGSPALGTYQHGWQSTVQGFANAQTPDVDILTGEFDHIAEYYDRVVDLQAAGAQVDYGTVTTNKLTYQAQFGTQQAAMMPMGSWYVATLIAQQTTGDAETFEWGFAPIPQFDEETTGLESTPVTFGDPTGLGINPAIDEDKIAAAKAFLAWAAGEEGATAMAEIGITPATTTEGVTEAYFGVTGVPTDDLSKFAFATHETKGENPVSEFTAPLQNILNDAHSAMMSGSESVESALAKAEQRASDEVLP